MMTDPIADMLTRIRNAARARKNAVSIPHSNLKNNIAHILKSEGYILDVNVVEAAKNSRPTLEITLKYDGRIPAIRSIKRESKPGHRTYCKATDIPTILNGYGIAILSTSQGLMTNKEAQKKGLGGEILCSVY